MNAYLRGNSDDGYELSSEIESSECDQSDERNPEQQYTDQEHNPESNSITSDNGDWCDIEEEPSNFGFEVRNIELKYEDEDPLSTEYLPNVCNGVSFRRTPPCARMTLLLVGRTQPN